MAMWKGGNQKSNIATHTHTGRLARNATKYFILLALCHCFFPCSFFWFLLNVNPNFKYLRCVLFACMCDGKQHPQQKQNPHIKRGCDHSQFHFHSHSHSHSHSHCMYVSKLQILLLSLSLSPAQQSNIHIIVYCVQNTLCGAHRKPTRTQTQFDTLPFGMCTLFAFCWWLNVHFLNTHEHCQRCVYPLVMWFPTHTRIQYK